MAALLTMGWAGAVDGSRDPAPFDIASTLAAALMITASSAASVLEQARVDNEPALAQRNGAGDGSSSLPDARR